MNTVVRWLATIVRKVPGQIIIAILAITAVLGAFAPRVEMTSGIEVFVPDNAELRALEAIDEHFGTSESTVQILIQSDSGDVITAEGVQVALRVETAIRSMEPAIPLSTHSDEPIVGYLSPVLQMAEYTGASLESLTDTDVKTLFSSAVAGLPDDRSALLGAMLSATSTDWETASTGAGLMVVVLDTSGIDFDTARDMQRTIADTVSAIQIGDTTVTAYSRDLFLNADPLSSELMRLFAYASVAIVLILASVYWVAPKSRRNFWVTLRRMFADLAVTLAAISISIVWMLGIAVLLGPDYLGVIDDFSPVLQILPVLLIGLGVDFAIHMTARYREELGSGRSVADSAERATATVGIALVLATITTAVGFLTNVANPIPPVKDFGIIAAIGIAGAFLIALIFVPAVRSVLDRRAERRGTLPRGEFEVPEDRLIPRVMSKLAILAEHLAVPTLALALVLAGLGVVGMMQLTTEFDSTDFVPSDDPLRIASATLTEQFQGGLGETVDIVIEGAVMTPSVHNALLAGTADLAGIEGVIAVDGYAAAASPISVIRTLLQPDDSGAPADPEFATLAISSGMNPDLSVSADSDVVGIYRAALQAAPEEMATVLAPRDGTEGITRIELSTQAGDRDAGVFAAELYAALQPVSALPSVTVTVTSVGIMTHSVVTALQESQTVSLAITLVAAMLLLVVTFWVESRRPFLGVITILPVVFVVLWTYGLMAVLNIPFGPVTAMTSALAIGIGVPYSIHVTHRYLEDRTRFEPEAAMRSTTGHTGGALLGSAMTTLAGFGVLMTSKLRAFQHFGAVTTIAVGLSLVAAVGVLPSMLVLWDRWHTEGKRAPGSGSPVNPTVD